MVNSYQLISDLFLKCSTAHDKTYTSIVRSINDSGTPETVRQFKKVFKEAFDLYMIEGKENAEELALEDAIKYLDKIDANLVKNAAPIQMGEPEEAGKFIAAMIQFLMRRISIDKRPHSIQNLKNKIINLNEIDLSSKRMPNSAAIGQSITLVKTVLMTHSPNYIRSVLESIVSNL